MNILEIFGLAFVGLVVSNIISMIWAIKKARMGDSLFIDFEQES